MLVFLGNLTPPFPGAGDDDSNFLLQVFGRDWLLVPIANFAVSKSGNDRMVRNHTEACWCAFERTQEFILMSADRPGKTRPVYQETVILQPNRERGRLPRVARPPPPRGVSLGYLGIEHVLVGLYVGPATLASFRDEVFDHLLMFHGFRRSCPRHSPLQKAALTVQQPPFFGILSWHVPDVPSGRSQAELMTMLREELPSLRKISLALFNLGALHEFGNIRRSLLDHRSCEIPVVSFEPPCAPVPNRTAFPALVELGEKQRCVLSVFEIRPVEPGSVVVSNEAAVEMEMLVEATREVLEP